jgi:hypothetical protein
MKLMKKVQLFLLFFDPGLSVGLLVNDRRQKHGPGKFFKLIGADVAPNRFAETRSFVAVDIIPGSETDIAGI